MVTGKSDANGKFTAFWNDGIVNLYDQVVVEVLDNSKFKRTQQNVNLDKNVSQAIVNLIPTNDVSVQIKIKMANCSDA